MKTIRRSAAAVFIASVATALITGCAVSPDYSNYDWHSRGGMVDEQDRSLAAARFEPFQGRREVRARADEPLTPPGASTARQQEVIIDPGSTASRPIVTRTRTVAMRDDVR